MTWNCVYMGIYTYICIQKYYTCHIHIYSKSCEEYTIIVVKNHGGKEYTIMVRWWGLHNFSSEEYKILVVKNTQSWYGAEDCTILVVKNTQSWWWRIHNSGSAGSLVLITRAKLTLVAGLAQFVVSLINSSLFSWVVFNFQKEYRAMGFSIFEPHQGKTW